MFEKLLEGGKRWTFFFVVVQSLSHVWLCNPSKEFACSTPGSSILHYLPVCSDCPLNPWCYLSHPLLPSFCFSLPQHQSLTSGGQSIGASASASVLPMNIQVWFPLGLFGLILQPKGLKEPSPAPQFKSISSLALSLLYGPTHICALLLEKP